VSRACARFLRLFCVGRRRYPPWRSFGHPLSPARSVPAEEAADTDHEPTKAFVPATHREACRLPENRDAFCRHDTRRSFFQELLFSPRDCSLSAFAPALSLTPPTLFPQVGESALLGIASVRVRSPAIHDGPPDGGSRVQTPFLPSESRLGLTTQACRLARPTRPSTGAVCPARTDVGRSA